MTTDRMSSNMNDLNDRVATLRAPDRARYPELAGYARDELYRDCLGGGGLYLAARMARTLRLQAGDIVLDLGCGKGETSIYLARHFGVQVLALDLWTPASWLSQKFSTRGYRQRILPLHLDVTGILPFADDYFDAIFCMNSFSFYGGSQDFLQHLLPHLKTGGQLCLGSEVLTAEFTAEQLLDPPAVYAFRLPPPNEAVDVFEDDFKRQHTPGWWRALFEHSGALRVEHCAELDDADVLYEELVRYEHEQQTDPFDVEICLAQMDWGRRHEPCKSLFVLTASKL